MSDVTPNFKPSGPCGCGCGVHGTLRVKPWRSNNVTCVVRGCFCKQCTGRRSKKGGQYSQQAKGARAIAGKRGKTHEQHDRFAFRWENKKSAGISGPVHRAWDKLESEDDALRPLGDNRVFIARVELPNARGRFGLVMIRDDQLFDAWHALGVENGWRCE